MHIQIILWSCWLNLVTSFAMGSVVFFSKPLTKVKVYWAGMCLMVTVWSLGFLILISSENFNSALVGSKIIYFSSPLIPAFLLHMVFCLLNKKPNRLIVATYSSSLLIALLSIGSNMMSVEPIYWFKYYTNDGPYYWIYMIHLYGLFGTTTVMLWLASKKEKGAKKKQLRLLCLGTLFGFLGGQTTIPLVYGFKVYPFGIFFVPIYVIFVGYGMLRYQFLDFKIAVQKLSIAAGIYCCFLLALTPVFSTLINKLSNQQIPFERIGALIALSVIVGGAGPFTYAWVVNRTFWLRTNLATGLTHELKSPISIIQSTLEVMETSKEINLQSNKSLKCYVDILQKQTNRLATFTKDLLHIAHIQEGNVELQKTEFSPGVEIKKIIDEYRPLTQNKGLALEFKYNNTDLFYADKEKFSQIISNLLSNAIKFTEGGGIIVELSVSTTELYCSVTDTGIGISPTDLPPHFHTFLPREKRKSRSWNRIEYCKSLGGGA